MDQRKTGGAAAAFGTGAMLVTWALDGLGYHVPRTVLVLITVAGVFSILYAMRVWGDGIIRWVKTRGKPSVTSLMAVMGGVVLVVIGVGLIWWGLAQVTAAAQAQPSESPVDSSAPNPTAPAQTPAATPKPIPSSSPRPTVEQHNQGASGPIIGNVQGNVTINPPSSPPLPPRDPNGLYQFGEKVGEVQGAITTQPGYITFASVSFSKATDPTREFEYQDWVISYPQAAAPADGKRPAHFFGLNSGTTTARILRKRP
jgi:hypothetical protein